MTDRDKEALPHKQQWFDASSLCTRMHIGKTTFYRWIAEGRFPEGKRMGKRAVRWHESTISEWENSRDSAV